MARPSDTKAIADKPLRGGLINRALTSRQMLPTSVILPEMPKAKGPGSESLREAVECVRR